MDKIIKACEDQDVKDLIHARTDLWQAHTPENYALPYNEDQIREVFEEAA